MKQKLQSRKTKRGIPVVIILILAVLMASWGWEPSFDIVFFGFYIMMVYNILYYRKLNKRPMVELLLVQPLGLLGLVILLPARWFDLLIGPTILFALGSEFAMMSLLYSLQEKVKRKRCDILTVATVMGNEKKRTTKSKQDQGMKHYGASVAYSYSPIVAYAANSEPQEVTYGDGLPTPMPIGSQVEILYNSKDPEEFCFADKEQVASLNIAVMVFFGAGLCTVVASVIMLLKRLYIF